LPVLAVAAIIGGGLNVYNNWDKVVQNPWSAIGYAVTGAAAGAVSIANPGLAKTIAAAGNIATDIATGNTPNFSNPGDVVGYALNTTLGAFSVAGAGSLAKMGYKAIKPLTKEALSGVNFGETALDAMYVEWENEWLRYVDEFVVTANRPPNYMLHSSLGLGSTGVKLGVSMHEHHSYPKYLGGDPKQHTTTMTATDHKNLHKDMNDFMRQQTDAKGNHMRPQRGNNKYKIQKNFTTQQREQALKDFYRGPGAKYKRAAKDFFKQVSRLR
jgi:hypothetical protein